MTITVKTEKQIEIPVPCYRKNFLSVVRVESDKCATEVHIWSEGRFSICRTGFGVEKFFATDFESATEEDFNAKMSAAIVLASEISTEETA